VAGILTLEFQLSNSSICILYSCGTASDSHWTFPLNVWWFFIIKTN